MGCDYHTVLSFAGSGRVGRDVSNILCTISRQVESNESIEMDHRSGNMMYYNVQE